jgi:hypothetical protein
LKRIAPSVFLFVLISCVAIAAVTYGFALIFNGIQNARLEAAQEQASAQGRELTPEEKNSRFPTIELF